MKKTFILQQQEISFVKNTFTQNLIEQLGIIEVQGPILSEVGNGMQDNLSGIEKAVQVNVKCIPNAVYEVVHSLAKWKRHTLARFHFKEGEGLFVHMKALRPDEDSLDQTHSVYVDQWDWEKVIPEGRRNFAYLKELLSDCADKLILPEAAAHSNPSWFGFLMTCREGVDRTKVVNYIESHGVQTRMLFSGNLIKHPCFDDIRGTEAYRVVGGLEQTDRIMTSTFWVGVYPGMTDEKIEYMAKVIHEALEG